MKARARNVRDYIEELEKSKKDREEQVREGLEIYIGLWKKAIERGVVAPSDDVESALEKIEEKGGLYKVAEE
jgi:hypothetical protein